MKKIIIVSLTIALVTLILFLTNTRYPNLKSDATTFTMEEYKSEIDDTLYGSITYNNRVYIPYGTLKGHIKTKDIKECIGYIIQDENSSSYTDKNDKDTRVYTLTKDEDENFLMIYYIGTTLMSEPDFFRAIDTNNKNINIPSFIDNGDYGYWTKGDKNE